MKNIFRKIGLKKNIFLSIVALILIFMLSVGVTYSWIEDIKLVTISTDDSSDNHHPLNVGGNIDAEYEVNATDNFIDLGLYNWDNTSSTVKQLKRNNEYHGYFYESGDMHLSPCYSDGNTFYFPTQNNNSANYRLGNHDDDDVNYISTTLLLYSQNFKTEFWFDRIPTITLKDASGNQLTGTNLDNAKKYLRFSVTIDGSTTVFSMDGSCKTVTSVNASSTTNVGAHKFSEYTYGNEENTNTTRGKNGNTVFALPKYDSSLNNKKVVSFKIWLEKNSNINSVAITDIDFKLISTWDTDKKKRIYFEDETSGADGKSWVKHDSAKVYLAIPAMATNPTNWKTDSNAVQEFTKLHGSYVEIPMLYGGEKMYVFRCKPKGFDHGDHSNIGGTGVNAWNYWESELPDTYHDETYSVYGNSYDETLRDVYKGDRTYENDNGAQKTYTFPSSDTFEGYGTWGELMDVKICNASSQGNQTEYKADDTTHIYLEDYSDLVSLNKVYVYIMYCTNKTNTTNNLWQAKVPKTSTKIAFYYRYKDSNNDQNRYWGFSAQTNATTRKSERSYTTGYERGANDTTFYVYNQYNATGGIGQGTWGTAENEPEQTNNPDTSSGDTDNMTGYNTDSNYYLHENSNNSYRFKTNGTDYKVEVDLTTEKRYFTILNGSTNYGLSRYEYYSYPSKTTPFTINTLDNGLQSFGLRTDSASDNGTYIVRMHTGDNNTLVIDSVKRKATS